MSVTAQHRLEVKPPDEPTIGKLVSDASRDISTLIHAEIALAKAELKVTVTNGGIGAALLAGAAFVGVLVVIMLSLAVAFFIVMAGLDPAWAFLIVTVFYLIVAAVLVLVGIKKLKRVGPPEKTIATAKKVPQALKGK